MGLKDYLAQELCTPRCGSHPIRDEIRGALQEIVDGEVRVSWPRFQAYLADKDGGLGLDRVPAMWTSIRSHVVNHEPELWAKAKPHLGVRG